ncbi:hypothetical protein FE784_00765 [Paenibacillus hemerocallicola]|uniref:Phage protein n=1 Tax=Paenibacillus hemerocallicola TaxID=1172614 RepID=A0A5C4TGX6_9BACL|nr:hypothetical protein [Paenibacillus hemerocallicola]TNJ68225.1 hypothetical protein FE784_00765 [Paenibacillus hemerocallicola]
MPQITFNDVRYGVNAALDAAFFDIPIHGEEIKQQLNPPCFFVKLLEPMHTRELGRRYQRVHPFDVHYFAPARGNDNMYTMAEQLTSALQTIQVGGRPIRGTGMRFGIIDEVLHFFVDYTLHVWEVKATHPKMQTLEQKEGIKWGN